MRMEVNGRNSFTGNKRHIDIICFFIKDQVDKGELSTIYCPTYLMLEDYLTKTIQGALFHKFQDIIMGRVTTDKSLEDIVSY